MSIPKRRLFAPFWDSPPLHSPPGHINPKTIWNNFPQSGQGQGVGEERARGRAGGEASREAGSGGSRVVGEAGGRLCPRETHGRPWPCEWVARRHCVKHRGVRQMSLSPGVNAVASDGMERSGRYRRAAACAGDDGSCSSSSVALPCFPDV